MLRRITTILASLLLVPGIAMADDSPNDVIESDVAELTE